MQFFFFLFPNLEAWWWLPRAAETYSFLDYYKKAFCTDDLSYCDVLYRGAEKSLARPERKQPNVSVRMAWISFGALPCRGKKTWWQLVSRRCRYRARPWHASELVSFLVGLRTYQHPGNNTTGMKHLLVVHLRTGHEAPEGEWMYSSTLALTSALDGVGGQRKAPAALTPRKTR
jgi:hypothetical protein